MHRTTRLTSIVLLALFNLHRAAAGAEILPGPIPADVIGVIDGDTVKVRAHIWLGHTLLIDIRLAGVDAPETYNPGCAAERDRGHRAAAFVARVLRETSNGFEDPVETPADEISWPVLLTDIRQDKFGGRAVAARTGLSGAQSRRHPPVKPYCKTSTAKPCFT